MRTPEVKDWFSFVCSGLQPLIFHLHAFVLYENDACLLSHSSSFFVPNPQLEPDDIDVPSFFPAPESFLHHLRHLFGRTEYLKDIDPLLDVVKVSMTRAPGYCLSAGIDGYDLEAM